MTAAYKNYHRSWRMAGESKVSPERFKELSFDLGFVKATPPGSLLWPPMMKLSTPPVIPWESVHNESNHLYSPVRCLWGVGGRERTHLSSLSALTSHLPSLSASATLEPTGLFKNGFPHHQIQSILHSFWNLLKYSQMNQSPSEE